MADDGYDSQSLMNPSTIGDEPSPTLSKAKITKEFISEHSSSKSLSAGINVSLTKQLD
jgi:hypothetical protein